MNDRADEPAIEESQSEPIRRVPRRRKPRKKRHFRKKQPKAAAPILKSVTAFANPVGTLKPYRHPFARIEDL